MALYESVFAIMESLLPESSVQGFVRERSGAALPGISPSDTYLCGDANYVAIAGNGDAILPDRQPVDLPGIVPKLSAPPGATHWIGPTLGQHTEVVLATWEIDRAGFERLRALGVV